MSLFKPSNPDSVVNKFAIFTYWVFLLLFLTEIKSKRQRTTNQEVHKTDRRKKCTYSCTFSRPKLILPSHQ